MIFKIFVVYDSKAGFYNKPFFEQSTGLAVRGFSDACNDKDTQLFKHASDFTLFEIGEFDSQSGVIDMYDAFQSLGVGTTFKEEV